MIDSGRFENRQMEMAILLAAVESANEAFVTIDQQSKVIFFNRAAEQIFGYAKDEVIGHDLARIMMRECSIGHNKAVARYVESGEGRLVGHETQMTAIRKNGETFPALISFSVTEVSGNLYFTGIIRDVTETKALQDRIVQAERLAALGQAVAEINHEIKNPLLVIGGLARQLLKREKKQAEKNKLQMIADEVLRLEHLLMELKDLYTPHQLELEKVEINDLLQEVVALVEPDCRKLKIVIEIELSTDDLTVRADREKLKQVLINLVKNSIESMPDGGQLKLRVEREGAKVRIVVIDTGHGIAGHILPQILTPFFTTKKTGTGLGLSISKKIIEDQHGGTFSIDSKEQGGTVITIELGQESQGRIDI